MARGYINLRILFQKLPFQYFLAFSSDTVYLDPPAPALAHIHCQRRKEHLMFIVWGGDSLAVGLVNKGMIKVNSSTKERYVHVNQQNIYCSRNCRPPVPRR